MSAKKKGLIGAIAGAILITGAYIFAIYHMGDSINFGIVAVSLVGGAIWGFGTIFGWLLGMKWVSRMFGFATTVSLFTILFSDNRLRTFIVAFFFLIPLLAGIFTMCYLPGIFTGIKQIYRESRA